MKAHESTDLAGIFREHADGLTGAIRGILGPRADVQEVLQEAFLRAWRAWERQRESVQDPIAWVFVVTMNLARDVRRAQMRKRDSVNLEEVDPVSLPSKRSADTDPVRALHAEELRSAARAAVVRLKDTEKEVFLLRTSGERTFESIASILDIPVGTAKTRMRSALRHLRQALSEFAPPTPAPSPAPSPSPSARRNNPLERDRS